MKALRFRRFGSFDFRQNPDLFHLDDLQSFLFVNSNETDLLLPMSKERADNVVAAKVPVYTE